MAYPRRGDVTGRSRYDVDEQYCKMKFGSWTFSARQVTLEWYEDYRQVVDSIPSTYLLISHFFGVI